MASKALIEAIKAGDSSIVRTIIANDPSALTSREDPSSAVLTALYNGRSEIAEIVAARSELDIFEAAAIGRTERVADLVAANPQTVASQSADGWTPLHLAAFFGRTDTARELIDAGADLKAISSNSIANTPLNAALAGRGDEELVLQLLTSGADAAAPSGEGYTPLHIAASLSSPRTSAR